MTVLISDDFSVDTSANYSGAGMTITGGQCNVTVDDGFRTHDTSVTADRWIRIRILDASNNNIIVPGCGASGTGFGIVLASGANLVVDWLTNYTTFTTYDSVDTDVNATIGAYSAANFLGITVEAATEILRFWNNTTAAEPTAIDLWDASPPNATLDFSSLTNHNLTGDFVGFGTWDTGGSPAESFDDFSAGTISAAEATPLKVGRAPPLKPGPFMPGITR